MEVLELLVASETVLLGHCAVDGDAGEVLLDEKLVQGSAAADRSNEDDNLDQSMNTYIALNL